MTLIFIADPRSGKVQVKKGQVSKLKIFSLTNTYLVQFYLRIQKMSLVLTQDNYKFTKIGFKKVTSSPLPGFWAIAKPKKDSG